MLRQPAPGEPSVPIRLTRILLLAFLLVVFILPASYGLITDWWWFGEIGYQVVFTRALTTRVLLFLAAGGLMGRRALIGTCGSDSGGWSPTRSCSGSRRRRRT